MKNEITGDLGFALKYYRTKRGLSLSQLSEITGISKSYISRIEKGERKSPSVTLLYEMAKGLNIPMENLLNIAKSSDRKELLNFDELILVNDFIINGKPVDAKVKKHIIELYNFIVKPETEDKNKRIWEILDSVDGFKFAL